MIKSKFIICFLAALFSNASFAYSDVTKNNIFIQCVSPKLNLTFEINNSDQSVKNINYNQDLIVGHWSEAQINTSFQNMSLSQIIASSPKTDKVGVNFNRLKGTILLAGVNAPTKNRINEC